MSRPRSARRGILGALLVAVLAGCVTTPADGDIPTPNADGLRDVFALVTPASKAQEWAERAADLTARAAAHLASAPAEGADGDGVRRVRRELGDVRELFDASVEVDGGVLTSSLLLGFVGRTGEPPEGIRHESGLTIPVCLPEGDEFVSGKWEARHEQTIVAPDGTVTLLDVTISASVEATSAGGSTFDATGIHAHVRRTVTTPDGRSSMGQGSVEADLTGLTEATWASRIVQALVDGDVRVHTRDAWVRSDGFAYLGTATMSVDVPRMVQQAQQEAERGTGCRGWAMVPVELANTFLSPLGDVPEVRRWSGYVCGDPFTSAWHFTEEATTFRGTTTEMHRIVPLAGDEPFEGLGVIPRIGRVEDAAEGAPPFRLSIEERWPEGTRAVSHQRLDTAVVPAGDECAP